MSRTSRTVASAVLACIVLANAAQAQDAARRGRTARVGDAFSPVSVAEMLDAYALVQAQNALQLNDAQYGQFMPKLRQLQQTRLRHQQARNRLIVELRRLVGPQAGAAADEGALRERLKTLRDHDARAHEDMRRAYDALDEALDVRQQARFRLFEEQIERRKFDLIMRARQRAARSGGD